MRTAQTAAVLTLALLGWLAGCLVLSQQGFTTSSKRGEWSVFVPAPQAYVMAAIMFALSVLAVVWLLQQGKARPSHYVLAALGYGLSALWLTAWLGNVIR